MRKRKAIQETEQSAVDEPKLPEFTGKIRYTLTNDYMFKVCLQENQEALKNLVAALMQIPVETIASLEIRNSIIPGESMNEKTVIFDIRMRLNNSTSVDLEMQVENLGNWPERSMYYLCREYAGIDKNHDYSDAMKTVQVGILNFTPTDFPQKLFSNYYFREDESGHLYSDKLNIRMVNLNQLGKPADEEKMPELYHWAQLFKAQTWEEIEKMVADKKVNKDFVVTFKKLSAKEKIRMQCEAREDYYRNQADAAKYNHELGVQDGIRIQAAKDQAKLAEKDQALEKKDQALEKKDQALADKDRQIAELMKQIGAKE